MAGCAPSMPPLPTNPYDEQNQLRVAILAPLSGELATYGRTVRRAVELAFDEWNERRNDSEVFIQPVPEDTPCDATDARQVAERVVAMGIRFIIGGICSEAAIPIADVADKNGALFLATSATHPLVTVDASGNTRPLVFRTAFTYTQQGRAASRFLLQTLRLERVAVVNNLRSPFAREVVAAFREAFTSQGGTASIVSVDASQQSDLGASLESIITSDVQAVYVPDHCATMIHIQEALRAHGSDKALLAGDWWNVHELDLTTLEGVYLTAHYSAQIADPAALQWAARYRAAFAVEPDALAALAYDAAALLVQGIEQSESASPQAVAHTLSAIEYKGVTGRWRFNAQHDPLKQAIFLRVRDGALQFAGSAGVE